MRFRFIFVLAVAGMAAACRPAPTRPDLTGTWRFDGARSTLQTPAPDSLLFFIEHREPRFRLSNTHYNGADSTTFAIDLTTDSAEVERGFEGYSMRSRAYWAGDTLVWAATVTLSAPGEPIRNVVKYSLADGGRTFVANEHQGQGQVGHDNRWVFARR